MATVDKPSQVYKVWLPLLLYLVRWWGGFLVCAFAEWLSEMVMREAMFGGRWKVKLVSTRLAKINR